MGKRGDGVLAMVGGKKDQEGGLGYGLQFEGDTQELRISMSAPKDPPHHPSETEAHCAC